jgi:predicted transposase YbfD/YdcC
MAHESRSDHYAGGFPESISAFSGLPDPRSGRNKQHYFGEILFIAVAAVICQCEGFDDMERFAQTKEAWLRKYLKLPNGLPSDDTFRRVFTAIEPKAFHACFMTFTKDLLGESFSKLIAIDGKAVRHSFDRTSDTPHLHLLSAFACEQGLSLGQLAVDTKSNEITAVPKLLELLDLEGHTVSLDAMGCQKKIAQKLHLAHADYLLAVKGNHPHLHKRLEQLFGSGAAVQYAKEQGSTFSSDVQENQGHGRLEKRVVLATDALGWVDKMERESWLGLGCFLCVESHREEVSTGKKSVEKRYYLSSHKPDAKALQKMVRQHWAIENSCHWVLDVVWNEDASRIRKGNAAENVALLRKIALNVLKAETSVKDTIRGKRLRAAFSEDVLGQFLGLKVR